MITLSLNFIGCLNLLPYLGSGGSKHNVCKPYVHVHSNLACLFWIPLSHGYDSITICRESYTWNTARFSYIRLYFLLYILQDISMPDVPCEYRKWKFWKQLINCITLLWYICYWGWLQFIRFHISQSDFRFIKRYRYFSLSLRRIDQFVPLLPRDHTIRINFYYVFYMGRGRGMDRCLIRLVNHPLERMG